MNVPVRRTQKKDISMPRRNFSDRVRQCALDRSGGKCQGCGNPLQDGKFAYDHIIPDALGGEPVLSNCQVLCDKFEGSCHWQKTYREDFGRIAKAKRVGQKHRGEYRKPKFVMKSRGFDKNGPKRKIQSRGFEKRR